MLRLEQRCGPRRRRCGRTASSRRAARAGSAPRCCRRSPAGRPAPRPAPCGPCACRPCRAATRTGRCRAAAPSRGATGSSTCLDSGLSWLSSALRSTVKRSATCLSSAIPSRCRMRPSTVERSSALVSASSMRAARLRRWTSRTSEARARADRQVAVDELARAVLQGLARLLRRQAGDVDAADDRALAAGRCTDGPARSRRRPPGSRPAPRTSTSSRRRPCRRRVAGRGAARAWAYDRRAWAQHVERRPPPTVVSPPTPSRSAPLYEEGAHHPAAPGTSHPGEPVTSVTSGRPDAVPEVRTDGRRHPAGADRPWARGLDDASCGRANGSVPRGLSATAAERQHLRRSRCRQLRICR